MKKRRKAAKIKAVVNQVVATVVKIVISKKTLYQKIIRNPLILKKLKEEGVMLRYRINKDK
jgi:hypothetical protein